MTRCSIRHMVRGKLRSSQESKQTSIVRKPTSSTKRVAKRVVGDAAINAAASWLRLRTSVRQQVATPLATGGLFLAVLPPHQQLALEIPQRLPQQLRLQPQLLCQPRRLCAWPRSRQTTGCGRGAETSDGSLAGPALSVSQGFAAARRTRAALCKVGACVARWGG